MRINNSTLRYVALFIFGLFLIQPTDAQTSANHTANITADEFTAKGGAANGWAVGQTVPNLYFNDVFTKKFHLHDKLEKATVIEIYSPTDAASKKNKTYLKTFFKQYDINIISIASNASSNQLRQAVKNGSLDWPHVQDDSKKFTGSTFAQSQNLDGVKFILVSGNKQVKTVVKNNEPIGKLGASLQQYFANY